MSHGASWTQILLINRTRLPDEKSVIRQPERRNPRAQTTVTTIARNKRKATITSAVMDDVWEIDTRELQMYCYTSEADIPQPHTVMDEEFMRRNAYIRHLELPRGWQSLSDEQAARFLDNFTTPPVN